MTSEADGVGLRDMTDRLRVIGGATVGPSIVTVAVLTAANVALDQIPSSSLNIVSGIVSVVAQYYLTRTALARRGYQSVANGRRFGSLWGVGLLSGLGILLGLVLLVVPGVYLAARWSIAGPVVLADDSSANEALGRSWALTKKSAWNIALMLVVIFLPAVILALGCAVLFSLAVPIVASALLYLFSFSGFAVSWLAYVALYSLLTDRHDHLADVFA